MIDIVVIGAGPAGLAAAIAAHEEGAHDIVIIERSQFAGGILNQCIHNGFGLHIFKEDLTGPEYAARFLEKAGQAGIEIILNTMVTKLNSERELLCISSRGGLRKIKAKAVVLAMGCRERPRGALGIPGFRGAGMFTAGTAQRLVNIEGLIPGKNIVVVGSGDIGLIMARRMCLEGADVKAVIEIMPYSTGLIRNRVQCLDDFGIPLLLKHSIVDIAGKDRVTGITIAEVNDRQMPIPGTERFIECDTILFSVGLIPENELTLMAGVRLDPVTGGAYVSSDLSTNIDGIYACGNALHVHDLVDYVSEEARLAGISAAKYALNGKETADKRNEIRLISGGGIRYLLPQMIGESSLMQGQKLMFRVGDVFHNKYLSVYYNTDRVYHRKKRVMAPGEMEQIDLPIPKDGEMIKDIRVCVEES